MDVDRMFKTVLASEVGREITAARGGDVQFGVAVKVYPWPERVRAVWVMIAVRFTPAA
jgi:hypothetical protein